jgi:predicted ArsR family transcriptional regulator
MDQLPVFKALGDNTRYAIYLELARSPVPLSTAEIAAELGLHPNTVRPHLERMRDVGLLSIEVDNRGTVGRPQHRYSLAADAPSLGLEPAAYPLLAALLANVAALFGPDADAVADIARDHGRRRGEARRTKAASCAEAVQAELAELGFDPESAEDGHVTTIAFTRCPFRPLAEAFPELVCHLHRGMVEGMVDVLGGEVARFGTLEDREPCQVDLALT